MRHIRHVLVTGGAGYVGSVLVPRLLEQGFGVRVLDRYFFGERVLDAVKGHPNLEQVRGDIRDLTTLRRCLKGCDAVVHLACISNDPSFDLDPALGRSINFEAFKPLVYMSKTAGIRRFVYASSSSVYGVSEAADVTEEHPLVPLTDYSKYKAQCEPILLEQQSEHFTPVIVRPATVCGYSPRQRLDLTVNILTNLAVNTGRITVFGGNQMRPNIHIDDMVALYLLLLQAPDHVIAGQILNAGYQNHMVAQLAEAVREVVQEEMPGRQEVEIVTTPTDDHRSYHISSEKLRRVLGFAARRTIQDAVRDLVRAFQAGKLPDSLTNVHYFNVKTMQTRKAA
jgi:nucleoside-diphosphate-sugar epimerase